MKANLFRASEMGVFLGEIFLHFSELHALLLFNFIADFPFHDIKTVLCLSWTKTNAPFEPLSDDLDISRMKKGLVWVMNYQQYFALEIHCKFAFSISNKTSKLNHLISHVI